MPGPENTPHPKSWAAIKGLSTVAAPWAFDVESMFAGLSDEAATEKMKAFIDGLSVQQINTTLAGLDIARPNYPQFTDIQWWIMRKMFTDALSAKLIQQGTTARPATNAEQDKRVNKESGTAFFVLVCLVGAMIYIMGGDHHRPAPYAGGTTSSTSADDNILVHAPTSDDDTSAADPEPVRVALPEKEAKDLIAKVKNWRPQGGGDTVDQIMNKVMKATNFVSRGWKAETIDGSRVVTMSWVESPQDEEDDALSISFKISSSGKISPGGFKNMFGQTGEDTYVKIIELGWQPLALYLSSQQVDDSHIAGADEFVHNLANYNFIMTPYGRLGDLLAKRQCSISSDAGVDIFPPNDISDEYEIGVFVQCKIPGGAKTHAEKLFAEEGHLFFQKIGAKWEGETIFAYKVIHSSPEHWFDDDQKVDQLYSRVEKLNHDRPGVSWRAALPGAELQTTFDNPACWGHKTCAASRRLNTP